MASVLFPIEIACIGEYGAPRLGSLDADILIWAEQQGYVFLFVDFPLGGFIVWCGYVSVPAMPHRLLRLGESDSCGLTSIKART